jgi:hypothetical protein
MIGANTLQLNTATMIDAVQEYLDTRLLIAHRVKVTDVKTVGTTRVFEVLVENKPAAKEAT